MKAAALAAISITLMLPSPTAAACHFAGGVAVGCLDGGGAQNAVNAHQMYGDDKTELKKDYVQATLNRYRCSVLFEDAGHQYDIRQLRAGKLAQLDGWKVVRWLELKNTNKGGLLLWFDDGYIKGDCDPPDPPSVHVYQGN